MPFCPRCKCEYNEGIDTCADCDERLVAQLPVETVDPSDDIDWVPLARLTSPQYAEMVREVLEAKSIPVTVLSSTGHFGITGQMGFSSYRPIGGMYTVMVARNSLEDATGEAETVLGDAWEHAKIEPQNS